MAPAAVRAARRCDHLLVTATRGSDLWQHTSYGFRRDSGRGDAVTIGRGVDDEPFRLVRVAPLPGHGQLLATVLLRPGNRRLPRALHELVAATADVQLH